MGICRGCQYCERRKKKNKTHLYVWVVAVYALQLWVVAIDAADVKKEMMKTTYVDVVVDTGQAARRGVG